MRVLDTVFTDLPEHTCGNSLVGTAVFDSGSSNSTAHFDHGIFLLLSDLSLFADSNDQMPGFFDGDETNFPFKN